MPKKQYCNDTKDLGNGYEEVSHESGYRKVRQKTRDDIDPEQVFRLAQIDATPHEIAHVLKINVNSLIRHFSDVIESGHNQLRVSIRRRLAEKALSGDMSAIRLYAENRLGYNPKVTIEQKTITESDEELLHRLERIDTNTLSSLMIRVAQKERDERIGPLN